jgi:uncharacterized protein with NRDE domain
VERKIAELIDGSRIPVTGRRGEDIRSEIFYPDVKSRKVTPKKYFTQMKKAESDGYNFIKLKHNNIFYYLWRVGKTKKFLSKSINIRPLYLLDIMWPETGFKWLQHISSTCPDHKIPCVIMHRPYVCYEVAFVLFYFIFFHFVLYS